MFLEELRLALNAAVAGLDQGTRRSAAQVEESAAAAQSLREQVERLVHAVRAVTLA